MHKAPLLEWRFGVPRWSLASQMACGRLFDSPLLLQASRPVDPSFEGRSLADSLAGRLLFFGLAGILSSSRYITGASLVAIWMPIQTLNVSNNLRIRVRWDFLHSGSLNRELSQKP
jgi:hypothetical protein